MLHYNDHFHFEWINASFSDHYISVRFIWYRFLVMFSNVIGNKYMAGFKDIQGA